MSDKKSKAFAIIKSKFTDSASSWRAVAVVKTSAKSIFVPGTGWKGTPDRVDIGRVVAFFDTGVRAVAVIAAAKEVEQEHQSAVGVAQMEAAKVEQEAQFVREAAIREARRIFDDATRASKRAVWEAAQAQRAAVAAFVAAQATKEEA